MALYALKQRAASEWVRAMRGARQQALDWLSPPRRWEGCHHPALERFAPWSGVADGRFQYDFLGVRTDPNFRPQLRAQEAGPLETAYPPPHAAYFELVFVLEAVLAAEQAPVFRMMELGAGYGLWQVTAHRAMQRSGKRPVELVGVEMDVRHFARMRQHFENNDLDPDEHVLLHAAVTDSDREVEYDLERDPDLAYGQRLCRGRTGNAEDGRVRVPGVDLRRLLREEEPFDLLHMDCQGEELRVLRHARLEVDARVGRLLVATHSPRIHRRLRRLFAASGWRCVYDFRVRRRCRTEFGDVLFLDGLLAWINPRFQGKS